MYQGHSSVTSTRATGSKTSGSPGGESMTELSHIHRGAGKGGNTYAQKIAALQVSAKTV